MVFDLITPDSALKKMVSEQYHIVRTGLLWHKTERVQERMLEQKVIKEGRAGHTPKIEPDKPACA